MSWKVVQTLVEFGYSIEEPDKSMLDVSKCIEATNCKRQDVDPSISASIMDTTGNEVSKNTQPIRTLPLKHVSIPVTIYFLVAQIDSTQRETFRDLLPSNVPTSLSFAYAFASVGRTS